MDRAGARSRTARTVVAPAALRHTMAGWLFMPVRPQGCATRLFSTALGHAVQPLAPHEATGQPSHGMHMAVPGTMGLGVRKWPGLQAVQPAWLVQMGAVGLPVLACILTWRLQLR